MKKLITSILFALIVTAGIAQTGFNRWVPASGTNTYSTNITSFPGSYNNTVAYIKFANTNTTTSTIAINGLSAQPLRKWDGDSWEVLVADDIDVNTVYKISYNGSYYELESFGGGGAGTALTDLTDISFTGLATNDFLKYNGTDWINRTPANVKTDLSLNNVENTALSTWAGSTNLTTLGTIGTGMWNGSTLGLGYGGTGSTAFTAGSIPYSNGSILTQNNSKFFWNNTDETLFVGANSTIFTGVKINSIGTTNSYLQNNIQNLSNGATASSDWIATADDGTDSDKYIDLGINSSGWSGTGMIDGQRTGYLYTKNVPLSIGTDGASTLKLFTGGTAAANERISIGSTGIYNFTGSSTAIHKELFPSLGVTQTNGAGLWLANTTSAALGAQQISPSLVIEGQVWETTGSTSQSVKYAMDVLPVQGTSAAGTWKLKSSLNGAAYIDALTVSGPGNLAITSGASQIAAIQSNGISLVFAGSGNGIGAHNNGGTIATSATVGMQYRSAGGTQGSDSPLHYFRYSGSALGTWATTYRMMKLANAQSGGSEIRPVSGAGGWINIEISPTYMINNGGGTATGDITGVLYAPVLTSMTGISTHDAWRSTSGRINAIETEAGDATLLLDADDGDDNADTWIIKSEASANDLTFTNHTTKLLDLTSDGRLYGTALHNNAGAVTGTTNQYIASGTYTPTLFNTTNIAGSTAYTCQWMRVGNVVTVSGKVSIDATAAAATELGFSLPIASAFTVEEDAGGNASSAVATTTPVAIRSDATNDRASFVFTAVSVSNDSYFFSFTYLIK